MTRADERRPTRRLVQDGFGADLVVELTPRLIAVRPKGTRARGPAEVTVSPGQLYQRLMLARADERRATRRRRPARAKTATKREAK